jgi:hypothetical protein
MAGFEIKHGALDGAWMAEFELLCRQWFLSIEQRVSEPREIAAYPQLQMIARQSGIPLTLYTDQTHPPAGIEDFFGVVVRSAIWKNLAGGRPLYLLRDYCSVRRQKPDENAKALGWHQDSAVVAGMTHGIGVSGYVAWVPITPIDSHTPTLQIIPNWFWPMAHQTNRETFYLESVTPPLMGKVVTIDGLTRGDILIFDLNCPHRTYVAPGMSKDRLSIDLRVVRDRPATYKGEMITLGA